MKRLAILAILAVAAALGSALGPSSWKWGPHRARADDSVVVMVTTAAGQQFVASTTEAQQTAEPYTADVVTADGSNYSGATVDVLDAAEVAALGEPVTDVEIDSWSW